MSDVLATGSAWLEGKRHAHMTQSVVYQRGADSTPLLATIGRTVFEQADEFGVVHRIEARDFLIRAADLVLAGETALPIAGDQITKAVGNTVLVYEVMPFGGEPPFRYSNPDRTTLRIHTKHVATQGPA